MQPVLVVYTDHFGAGGIKTYRADLLCQEPERVDSGGTERSFGQQASWLVFILNVRMIWSMGFI